MWIDAIVSGLTAGSLYCLVAVGFNILYRPTKVFNFAQGDLVMIGSVGSALLLTQLKWPWLAACAAAIAAVALIAVIEERVAVAPVLRRSAGGTAWIITTLAVAMIMTNLVGKVWGADPIVVSAPAPLSTDVLPIDGIAVSSYQIALVVLTVLLVAVVEMLYGSLWGKAAMAVAEDREAALLRGIEPASIGRWSFALGGAFAALTGALASPVLSASTALGGMLLLKGFAAAARIHAATRVGAPFAGAGAGRAVEVDAFMGRCIRRCALRAN